MRVQLLVSVGVLFLGLSAGVLHAHSVEAASSTTEPGHFIVFASDPGTPPAWAQSPSSRGDTRDTSPPGEAGAPGLPGPPSMPLPGAAFLILAGGVLVWRRLGGTLSSSHHQSSGTMRYHYLLPLLLVGLLIPATAEAQRLIEFPEVPGGTPVGLGIDISGGGNHTLMASEEGSVVAWGSNSQGQTDVPVSLTNVVQVAGGANHSLALRADGTVVGWGSNSQGQTNVPAGLSNVVQVAAGHNHSLALRADGTAVGWGSNSQGQADVPVSLTNVVQVAAGFVHSLALRADGTVVAWGSNGFGQSNVPAGLSNVVQVAAGLDHSLAVRDDGTVVAWGRNDFGQTNVPAGLSNVVQVAAGFAHSLALRADGTVVAWGGNGQGQASVPSSLNDVIYVAAKTNLSLALRADGTVVAWGSNSDGQTDVPPQQPLHRLEQVSASFQYTTGLLDDGTVVGWGTNLNGQLEIPDGLTDVIQVYSARSHSLALRSDGTVVAWGWNPQGQTDVPGDLTNVAQVAAGLRHSLAHRSDGTVVGWGWNGDGQIDVPGDLIDVVQIAAGNFHSLALRSDGTVVAWGDASQTGVPVDLTDAVQIAAGFYHSLALRIDGTVVAWGDNSSGQASVPPGLSDVVYVAGGEEYSFALRSDGTFVTWGSVPPEFPSVLGDFLHFSAGIDHLSVLNRLPGETSPYLHTLATRRASSFPAGSLALVDIALEDGDGLPVPVSGDLRVWGAVYDIDGDLLHISHTTLPEGEPWTYLIPEGVSFFRVYLRAVHEDYHYAVSDEVTFVLNTITPPVQLSIGSENEGPGWRMLSSSMVGSPVQRLANVNLVQGIPGEYEGADPNLYVGYDGNNDEEDPNRGFVVPTGLAHHLMPGKGFIWYLFDEDAEPNHSTPGESLSYELPTIVSFVGSSPLVENHSVTFQTSERSSVSDDGWYLVGNPYNQPYNVRGIVPTSGSYSSFYYHWDPTEGEQGEYVLFNGTGLEFPLPMPVDAPVGAGFFMQFSHYPTLPVTITFGPPLSGPPGSPDPIEDAIEHFMAAFELTGELLVEYEGNQIPVEISDRNARVIFSDVATDGFDFLDAGKLSPLSYYWANIALMGNQGDEVVRRSIESRPLSQEPMTIPMALSTYASGLDAGGAFTITLADHDMAEGWEIILRDLETDETINMLTDSHTFTINAQPAIEADERFELTFTAPTVSGEPGVETYEFGLEAVWPNPTASTSQVAFTLEAADEITIDVFDVLGRRVIQLASGEYAAGRHVLPMSTSNLSSGVYVLRLTAGLQSAVQRVTVAR